MFDSILVNLTILIVTLVDIIEPTPQFIGQVVDDLCVFSIFEKMLHSKKHVVDITACNSKREESLHSFYFTYLCVSTNGI